MGQLYLFHEGDSNYYIPSLVEEFYNSFTLDNINNNTHSIEVNRRGERKFVNLKLLSDLIGIPLTLGLNQVPMNLDRYLYMMWVLLMCQGGGIDAKTMYRNIYATCRWLDTNVLGFHMFHLSIHKNFILPMFL